MDRESVKIDIYESEIIRRRLSAMLEDQSIEDFVGPKYKDDVKECLDILDIGYTVTAVGILGRALEVCMKEYCEVKIKRKTAFEKNTSNVPIATIRKNFWGSKSNQADRLKLLNKQEVSKNRNTYKLKKALLKDEYYHALENIRKARNDAFHGCSVDEYREISAKSGHFIEHGLIILVKLVMDISRG
ncbi:hypothetical protein [Bacillus wiedmannii]|uniref:RiboL-PSP-HEPN domain-containing protein n=1 Tax=Bacillus wiedmannii TaxID=1890302 RepID=A0A2C4HZK2_9BACI|nr:hypothetical protein [Bacillus wiedmannii]PEJ09104.1 hypothetical protein CN684_07580 [Bacillus wiedmannii]PHC72558.1 hypothetical protein COF35_01895 [Bacillus wiedmannii]